MLYTVRFLNISGGQADSTIRVLMGKDWNVTVVTQSSKV
jgi:hypothetical protein